MLKINTQYLASEIFPSLPADLRSLSYATTQNDPSLLAPYSEPLSREVLESICGSLPVSVSDTIAAYGLVSTDSSTADSLDIALWLSPVLGAYIAATTAAPAPYASTRASACELCARSWIPLTYHHLIPRSVHPKALKKGWVAGEWELNKVAWLCRACHTFVHHIETNEELARKWSTVEVLAGREDVRNFVQWVGGVRWKKR
jgi:hypothetical protein